ncbi:oligosaccharide flippase family protein, partial [Anaerosporobacter sp.]|uniref:oligosaccharide flippase family protein n=1 Tax=Anaerosporobacter sp. TaxID=1872529 RepID=UPI00286EDF8C
MQKRFSQKGEIAMGTMLSFMSLGIGYMISILYTPFMLRILGQSEYGLYTLVASTASYLGMLSFGFDVSYVKFYFQEKKKGEEAVARLNGMYLLIFTGISLLSLVAGGILVSFLPQLFQSKLTLAEIDKAQVLMVVMVIDIALTFPASLFRSYITANEKFVFQKLVQILNNVLSPFLALPLLLMGFASTALVMVTLVINISVAIWNITYCIKKLNMKLSFRNVDFKLLKAMSAFSGFIFINIIVDQINWNVDKFILGIYEGTIAVAVYGIGAQISGYYRSFSSAVSNQFIPSVNKLVSESDDNQALLKLMQKVGRVQSMILFPLCIGLLFYGEVFIQLWAGKDYKDSYSVMMILVIPLTIPLVQSLGIEIQRAKNMHQFRSIVYFLIAILNVFLSVPLCKLYGAVGCAIGTAISLILGNGIAMNWYYHCKCKLNMFLFWKKIGSFALVMILPTFVGYMTKLFLLEKTASSLLLCGLIFSATYFLSLYLWGIETHEKEALRRLMKKLQEKTKSKKNSKKNI